MDDVSLVTTGHDLADARLHRIVESLARSGARVRVVGTGSAASAPSAAATVVASPRRSRLHRAWRAFVSVLTVRARVLVVIDPEMIVLARLWRRLHRGIVVADVHEDYRAVVADRAWLPAPLRPVARAFAGLVVRSAAAADVTVVADDHVPPRADGRLVVRNLPALDHLPDPGTRDVAPRAVYVGDIRASRGLWEMVDAVLATPNWSLDLIGAISEADAAGVRARASEAGRGADVRVHGRTPPTASWELARGAWVGFALLHDTPAFRAAVPTKLYEYAALGIPSVVTPRPRMVAFVDETGAGVAAGDAADVAARLRAWSDDPSSLDAYATAGRRWATDQLAGPTPFDALATAVRALIPDTQEGSP